MVNSVFALVIVILYKIRSIIVNVNVFDKQNQNSKEKYQSKLHMKQSPITCSMTFSGNIYLNCL